MSLKDTQTASTLCSLLALTGCHALSHPQEEELIEELKELDVAKQAGRLRAFGARRARWSRRKRPNPVCYLCFTPLNQIYFPRQHRR